MGVIPNQNIRSKDLQLLFTNNGFEVREVGGLVELWHKPTNQLVDRFTRSVSIKSLTNSCLDYLSVLKTYNEYVHFLGTADIDGDIVSTTRLMAWANNRSRTFICVYCGSPPKVAPDGFMSCARCKEYKGIMPDCPKAGDTITVNKTPRYTTEVWGVHNATSPNK